MQQTRVEQRLHHDGHAALAVDVLRMTYWPNGFMSARCGDLGADPVEVVKREIDLGLTSDREQVQHGVRRAAVAPSRSVIAFSNAFFVRMSRAVMPWRSMFTTASPERCAK